MPLYAVAHLLVGVQPYLLALVPAIFAVLVVAMGALIASQQRTGRAAMAGAVVVVALLALPTFAASQSLLRGGDHVGAVLLALLAFYALRSGGWGPGVIVATAVLAAATLGDFQVVAYGAAPVFVSGICAIMRRRSVRDGLPAMCAAAGAGLLAFTARQVADAAGTFSIGAANPTAPPRQMIANFGHAFDLGGQMLGAANTFFGTGDVPEPLQRVLILGAALVALCFAVALVRLGAGVVCGPARQRYGRARPEPASMVAVGAHPLPPR